MTVEKQLPRYLLRGLGGSLTLVAGISSVLAQSRSGLEEIIVTAQRTETSLQETPIAVTAFDAAALEQRGVDDLADLGSFAPSLTIVARPGAGPSRASFALRGMGTNAENGSAAVGVYVDEVYFPAGWGNALGLLDVERVEVLRGPQGTLFGRNTIAGAIQYVGRKPQREFGGYVTATGGNLDREHLEGTLNVPLGETVAMRVAASHDLQGGYVHDRLNDVDRGEVETRLGRLQFRWTPSENLTVDLKADTARQDTNGRPTAIDGFNPLAQFALLASLPPPNGFGPLDLSAGPSYVTSEEYELAGYNAPDFFTSEQDSYSATVAYDLGNSLSLKSISAYFESQSFTQLDGDMTPLPLFGGTRGRLKDEVFTQELQLTGQSLANRLDWTLGVYYFDGQATKVGQVSLVGPFQIPISVNDTRDDVTSIAGYGQLSFGLTDDLSLTAGVRYSEEEVDSSVTASSTGQSLRPSPYSFSTTFDDTSPYLGLDYRVTPDAMLYIKGSKGFRAGGVTLNDALIPANGSPYNGAVPFDPETAWTYEAGARLEFLERTLRINPTVFFTDWSDIQFNQLEITAAGPAITTLNAGDAELKGAELEIQWAPVDRLFVTASASYLDAQYTRVGNIVYQPFPFFTGTPPNLVPLLAPNLGVTDDLQQAPEFKFSFGGQYTQPLGNGAQLIGSADYGWTDEQQSSVTRTDSKLLPSYGLLNARLAYHSPEDRWNIALYGTNLLDEYYFIGAGGFGRGFTIGFDEVVPGRPREYGVTLRFNF